MELSVILAGLSLFLKITMVWFVWVAVRWMFARKEAWPCTAPKTRFAVVIAARNEGAVIGRLVRSLLEQDYPKELFDVFVVPNNCTDDTAEEAFRAGANILLCDYPVTQKGDALRQAFCQLRHKDYDAFVVFDADNVVDRQYLRKTNDAFCGGARVVKGRQMALNPRESWVAGCYDLYFCLFDLFYNRPRDRGGLSVKLIGTGFAVHHTVLEELGGWNTCTIAEDAEFAALCAMKDIRVCWACDAVTYDEEPVDFVVSLRQRKRWCSGVIQVGRKMLPQMIQKRGRLNGDMSLFLLTAQLAPVSALLLCASRMCAGISLAEIAIIAAGYWLGCAGLATGLLLAERPRERRCWRCVFLFPVFMLSWLPLQVLALFHKTTVWRQIGHGREKSMMFRQ